MNLEEFGIFFHFFRSEIKLYPIGYNIGIFETNCIISSIIWGIGMGNGRAERALGATTKCAMQITILGNYWQYPLI